MPTITIENIPDDLYERLRRSAEAHGRSIECEAMACLERALASRAIAPEAILDRARRLREMTAGYAIDDDAFTAAKRAGQR